MGRQNSFKQKKYQNNHQRSKQNRFNPNYNNKQDPESLSEEIEPEQTQPEETEPEDTIHDKDSEEENEGEDQRDIENDEDEGNQNIEEENESGESGESGENVHEEAENEEDEADKEDTEEQLMKKVASLLQQINSKLSPITTSVTPLLSKAEKGEIATSKGLSYLEVKHQLLLSYISSLCFVLLLKAQGFSLRSHPIINHLIKYRTIMEKTRPLDKKLKYQIDKLLKIASVGNLEQVEDSLHYKPRLQDLMTPDDETASRKDTKQKPAIYQPPKLTPVTYHVEKKSERNNKEKKKASSSAMMKFIQHEFGDEPEETPLDPILMESRTEKEIAYEAEKTKYEEEHFLRLPETKKERKARRTVKFTNALAELENFGELRAFTDSETREPKNYQTDTSDQLSRLSGKTTYDYSSSTREKTVDMSDITDGGHQIFMYDELGDEKDDELHQLYQEANKEKKRKWEKGAKDGNGSKKFKANNNNYHNTEKTRPNSGKSSNNSKFGKARAQRGGRKGK